ncbi:flagellar basal body-associated protein FliL [Limnohabitans sp. DM1]|uniref:flagellar basal body-associated FliL family protein n=1 Tax=Limnohabitans sp. DM1 TaxID=1597955 RepID=UPI000A6C83DA|nr:flagellar basal body-associated FliL family protein [Limnohabitans sp. DM1]
MQDIEADPKKDPVVNPKGRKKLFGLIVLMLIISAVGVSVWFYFDRVKGENKEVESEESKLRKAPKLYFPLDPMVINLSDLGGDRFAQVGITFQIREEKSAEAIKKMLPTIRSAILTTLSQKASEELLSRQGKEKLALDILVEVGRVFGVKPDSPQTEQVKPDHPETTPSKNQATNPVLEVLFSSLIVQ